MQNKLRILHLEDLETDSELVDIALRRGDIQFVKYWAKDKEEFIKGLKEFAPDIILSDHSLGHFDSLDAIKLLKDTGLQVPFIIVTGHTSEEFVVEIIKGGADDYLVKDNLARLPLVIKAALKEKKSKIEREKAYEELSQREEHYFALIQNSKDMVMLISGEGTIVYQSPSGEGILGYKPSELIGTSVFNLAHPDQLDAIKERFKHRQEGGEPKGSLEYRVRHKNGEWRVFDSTISNLLHNPAVNAIVINSRDVTERKQLENKLVDKIKELDTFIYKASHDLKGPLSSIIGLLNLTKEEHNTGKDLEQYLEMIDLSTRKLDSVLNGLIETMRVKDVAAKAEEIDFNSLIEVVLNGLKYSSNFNKIHFDVKVTLANKFLSVTPIIHSILQNLVQNAVKYHKYEQDDPFVNILVYDLADGVGIIIEDNGHGMKNEILGRIFDMYYRGNESSQGSGLGLYIVKTAVNRLEGDINVASVEDKGTRFLIYIPSME